MNIKLTREDQVLDKEFRKAVIEEILGPENIERKKEAKKRYDLYKDKTKIYVEEALREEFSEETVKEMRARISNISFLKEIVDKKAMVFRDTPLRELLSENEKDIKALERLTDHYDLDCIMKKVDKVLEYQKNTVVFVCPYMDMIEQKWNLTLKVLQPYAYDVIEDNQNPEIARAFILSNFKNNGIIEIKAKPKGKSGVRLNDKSQIRDYSRGDGHDQIIADAPSDFGINENEFIWWTNNYHFTTDVNGDVINKSEEEDGKNPIGELTLIDFAEERDGQFWAVGGDDLVDSSILINAIITDMYHIAKTQGMGMFYFFGKGVPKTITVGPNKAITHEVRSKDDPTPQIGFANANPPIGEWMKMIEQALALLLSTNKLDPSSARGTTGLLGVAKSGLQEMIRKSDSYDDMEDKKQMFQLKEPKIVKVIGLWHNELINSRSGLMDYLNDMGVISDEVHKYMLEFASNKNHISEKEELEVIEKRRDLMLDDIYDSMIRDNPKMTRKQAEIKLKEIIINNLEVMKAKAEMMILEGMKNDDTDENNEENKTPNDGDDDESKE